MKFRNRDTGVVVNVRDGKVLGSVWEPADTTSAGSSPDNEDDSQPPTCGECGFVAKSAAGLSAHGRSHDS